MGDCIRYVEGPVTDMDPVLSSSFPHGNDGGDDASAHELEKEGSGRATNSNTSMWIFDYFRKAKATRGGRKKSNMKQSNSKKNGINENNNSQKVKFDMGNDNIVFPETTKRQNDKLTRLQSSPSSLIVKACTSPHIDDEEIEEEYNNNKQLDAVDSDRALMSTIDNVLQTLFCDSENPNSTITTTTAANTGSRRSTTTAVSNPWSVRSPSSVITASTTPTTTKLHLSHTIDRQNSLLDDAEMGRFGQVDGSGAGTTTVDAITAVDSATATATATTDKTTHPNSVLGGDEKEQQHEQQLQDDQQSTSWSPSRVWQLRQKKRLIENTYQTKNEHSDRYDAPEFSNDDDKDEHDDEDEDDGGVQKVTSDDQRSIPSSSSSSSSCHSSSHQTTDVSSVLMMTKRLERRMVIMKVVLIVSILLVVGAIAVFGLSFFVHS